MDADDKLFVDDEIDDSSDSVDDLDDDSDLDGGVIPDDYDDLDDLDDDDDDDYDDATPDDIDFAVALYREDGVAVATELTPQMANDLDELIDQLRRLPGDAGALGVVSIAGEFFVLCRVRGRNTQVLLNDSIAANDWPIARDVVDYLGVFFTESGTSPKTPLGKTFRSSPAACTSASIDARSPLLPRRRDLRIPCPRT